MTIAEHLANKPMWQIEGTARRVRLKISDGGYSSTNAFTFSDESFIEVDRLGHRQVFLANGWNVTQEQKS
jgi:hypothetical protein